MNSNKKKTKKKKWNIPFLHKKKAQKKKQKKRTKRQRIGRILMIVILMIIGSSALAFLKHNYFNPWLASHEDPGRPLIKEMMLSENKYSRPGIPLRQVNGIVIHYVDNPGTSARQNRDYFQGLKDNHETKASSHFIVGLKGEIIQCIPLEEISYASNSRNSDTISVEVCHKDKSGVFSNVTKESLVELLAWLCDKYGLEEDQIIRHYDITEKLCPIYYVKHPEAWEKLKEEVAEKRDFNDKKY